MFTGNFKSLGSKRICTQRLERLDNPSSILFLRFIPSIPRGARARRHTFNSLFEILVDEDYARMFSAVSIFQFSFWDSAW